MAISDPVVMPLAIEMLECLDQEIAKVSSPPLHVHLRPGTEIAAYISENRDECCEGLAWVRVAGFFPSSSTFPLQDDVALPKGTSSWAITLEIGAMRCAPTPDANVIPSAEDWLEITQQVMDDAAALRRAICCFIAGAPGRAKVSVPGAWQPLSVEGGCVGGLMTITVRGPACDCADAGPAS